MTHDTYSQLVRAPDDLVGLVAYSMYKRQKIDFLEERRAANGGAAVPKAEVDLFCATFKNETQVQMLRNHAGALLGAVTQTLLDEKDDEIHAHYQGQLVQQLKEGPSWWSGVWLGVAGNATFAVIIAVLLFTLSASNKGLGPAIINALGGEVKSDTAAPPPTTQPQPSAQQ